MSQPALVRDTELTVHGIGLAASIHDLSKINIPAQILAKPSMPTGIEIIVKTHAAT